VFINVNLFYLRAAEQA